MTLPNRTNNLNEYLVHIAGSWNLLLECITPSDRIEIPCFLLGSYVCFATKQEKYL